MLTPFTDSREIDWQSLDRLVEWYVDAGVAGLFPVSLSSEMYELTDRERLSIVERVTDVVDGSVPVVATGTFGRSIEAEAEFTHRLSDAGADAVVVNVAEIASAAESETHWVNQIAELLAATGDIPLGLYECPVPYHRLVATESLRELAETDRFVFVKDTCCERQLLAERASALEGSSLDLYNANGPLLLASLRDGADGYCGIAANFYPGLLAWLCDHYDDEPDVADSLARFLSIADYVVREEYPVAAKRSLVRKGVIETAVCRTASASIPADHLATFEALDASVNEWRDRLGVSV